MKRRVLVAAVAMALFATMFPAPFAGAGGVPEDWFRPGAPFDHQFPDPSVTPVGPYAIAYSTGQGGAHVPAMWTTDYDVWTARAEAPDSADPCYDAYENDAWENPGVGKVTDTSPTAAEGCVQHEVWAPTVAFVGSQWVAFAAVRESGNRFCIYRAVSDTPLGPFETSPSHAFHCDSDPNGSIDPDLFQHPDGGTYLLWKSEGVPGSAPTRLWVRKLNDAASGWASGSRQTKLLETDRPWEMSNPSTGAGVIENPSMVRAGSEKYYLFYSANEYRTAAYGQGYAVCTSVLGPCTKKTVNGPMSGLSGSGRWGAGGGDAFVDDRGRLLLQYHAWDRVGGVADPAALRKPHTALLVESGDHLDVRRADNDRGAGQDYLWNYTPGGYTTHAQTIGGTYTPVAGRFGADAADDVFFYGAGDRSDVRWQHAVGGSRTSVPASRDGSFVPLVGNFDGDPAGIDDIYWYAPLRDPSHPSVDYGDEYWIYDSAGGHVVIESPAVKQDGVALPLVGDFDGDGTDQIFWYAPGGPPDSDVMWELSGVVPTKRSYTVGGYYQYPQVGDFDGNGVDDIVWYAPGTRDDYVWFFDHAGEPVSRQRTANGTYIPMTGDFDGNGIDDIVWYGPGTSPDYEWNFEAGGAYGSRARTVNGYYTTVVGDYDGNEHDDILWYQ